MYKIIMCKVQIVNVKMLNFNVLIVQQVKTIAKLFIPIKPLRGYEINI